MKIKKDIDIHHAKVLLDQYLFEEKAYIDDGQKTPVSFTPYTITSDRYEILSSLCEKVYSAIEKLLRYFVKDQDTQALFPELISYRRLSTFTPDYKYWTFLARFDIAESQDGDFKLLETNCACPGGFFLFSIIKKAFNKIGVFEKDDLEVIKQPIDDEFIFFYSLVNAYREVYKLEPQNITLLTSKVHPLINEIDLMVKVGTNLGLECFHCPIQDLIFENGCILSPSKKKIDLAYIKVDAFIDKETNSLRYFLYENSESEIPAFLQGVYNKQITCFNSFPSAFVGENKRILALLTDKRFHSLFSKDEIEAIKKFCPKTFCLSKKEEDYKIK